MPGLTILPYLNAQTLVVVQLQFNSEGHWMEHMA